MLLIRAFIERRRAVDTFQECPDGELSRHQACPNPRLQVNLTLSFVGKPEVVHFTRHAVRCSLAASTYDPIQPESPADARRASPRA